MLLFAALSFSFILFACYYKMVLQLIVGWTRLKTINTSVCETGAMKLSCIVPFRNEQDNLTLLIKGLKNQQDIAFEIILIDDHSSDGSWLLAENQIANQANFKLIKNKGKGKKAALATGVEASSSEFIVFTDADCLHTSNWLSTMAHILKITNTDLLVGPVRLTKALNFLEYFQTIDFLSLVTSSAGAIGANNPIMCNGANLAVSKKIWLQAQSSLKSEWASGDDIFLLQYCKANKKNIAFAKSENAIVHTYPAPNLKAFLGQRARWASKSKAYTDSFTIYAACLVLLTNSMLLTLPLAFWGHLYLGVTLTVLCTIKIGLDYLLIKRGALFFDVRLNPIRYMAVAIIYPLYIVISVSWAILGDIKWKNRNI